MQKSLLILGSVLLTGSLLAKPASLYHRGKKVANVAPAAVAPASPYVASNGMVQKNVNPAVVPYSTKKAVPALATPKPGMVQKASVAPAVPYSAKKVVPAAVPAPARR